MTIEKLKIRKVEIKGLSRLPNSPFIDRSDESKRNLLDSIRREGVMTPIIVHSSNTDNIVVDGWRRVQCCVELRQEYIPAVVYTDLCEAEMMLMAINSNISYRQLLISERAWAYRRKLEALKELINYGEGERSQSILAADSEDSARKIQRLIRLTYLIPEWLELVDRKRMAILPAVELSYLTLEAQQIVYECMRNLHEDGDVIRSTITHGQAIAIRKLSREDELTVDAIYDVIDVPKPNQKDRLHIDMSDIADYMPQGYNQSQCRDYLIRLVKIAHKQRIEAEKAKKEMSR